MSGAGDGRAARRGTRRSYSSGARGLPGRVPLGVATMATPRRTPPRRLALLAALALAVLAAPALYLAGRSGDEAATGPGGPAPAGPGEQLLVLAEFGPTVDEIFLVPAGDPSDRTSVARVEHASGWGIHPAPEMAGAIAAYTVLPPDARPERDSPAELWLLDVESGERTRLARDADLLAAPALARDGAAVVYRTSTGDEQSLVRVDLQSRSRRVLHTARTPFGLFPVALTPGGDLLFSEISSDGTVLHAVPLEGGEPRSLFRASAHIARDWRLSPDGTALSYLAPVPLTERIVHRLHVAALAPGAAPAQPAPGGDLASEQYGPVWRPRENAITVGGEAASRAAGAVTLPLTGSGGPTELAAPPAGFDVPLGWSPDGRVLAVRSFGGRNAADPGAESVALVDGSGARRAVPARAQLIFLGWWTYD